MTTEYDKNLIEKVFNEIKGARLKAMLEAAKRRKALKAHLDQAHAKSKPGNIRFALGGGAKCQSHMPRYTGACLQVIC